MYQDNENYIHKGEVSFFNYGNSNFVDLPVPTNIANFQIPQRRYTVGKMPSGNNEHLLTPNG